MIGLFFGGGGAGLGADTACGGRDADERVGWENAARERLRRRRLSQSNEDRTEPQNAMHNYPRHRLRIFVQVSRWPSITQSGRRSKAFLSTANPQHPGCAA